MRKLDNCTMEPDEVWNDDRVVMCTLLIMLNRSEISKKMSTTILIVVRCVCVVCACACVCVCVCARAPHLMYIISSL